MVLPTEVQDAIAELVKHRICKLRISKKYKYIVEWSGNIRLVYRQKAYELVGFIRGDCYECSVNGRLFYVEEKAGFTVYSIKTDLDSFKALPLDMSPMEGSRSAVFTGCRILIPRIVYALDSRDANKIYLLLSLNAIPLTLSGFSKTAFYSITTVVEHDEVTGGLTILKKGTTVNHVDE